MRRAYTPTGTRAPRPPAPEGRRAAAEEKLEWQHFIKHWAMLLRALGQARTYLEASGIHFEPGVNEDLAATAPVGFLGEGGRAREEVPDLLELDRRGGRNFIQLYRISLDKLG